MQRNRLLSLLFALCLILLGLASRRFASSLPNWVYSYAGDALWALMIFVIVGAIFSRSSTRNIALIALVISWGIEISQLYHAPWIDGIRDTTLGGLVLGYGFLWSDFISYAVGIALGSFAENRFRL